LVPDGITPTPLVMRIVPAICGTLMVPAMYFLASRLVSRRTALLAAMFACFSAYLLNYSRDSKMYMQLWFFATLHVGCLLWWLDAYRRS
ncbi:glycosyltransferase family 39 protein, partial [Klebsiella pneumoniae]|nr:glycosyltransferase family 39 protein [Klebsiella pneumoniae]